MAAASVLSYWHPTTPAAEQASRKTHCFKNKGREGITWADPTGKNKVGRQGQRRDGPGEEVLEERRIPSQPQQGW